MKLTMASGRIELRICAALGDGVVTLRDEGREIPGGNPIVRYVGSDEPGRQLDIGLRADEGRIGHGLGSWEGQEPS